MPISQIFMTFSITEVIYWNDNQSAFRDLIKYLFYCNLLL